MKSFPWGKGRIVVLGSGAERNLDVVMIESGTIDVIREKNLTNVHAAADLSLDQII